MFGQRSANSNHEFDRAAILASVIRVNIRFDRLEKDAIVRDAAHKHVCFSR